MVPFPSRLFGNFIVYVNCGSKNIVRIPLCKDGIIPIGYGKKSSEALLQIASKHFIDNNIMLR